MTKKKIGCIYGICVLFATISLFFIVGNQLFRHKCVWWSCAPKRDFSIFELNIPSEYFPMNADIPVLQNDRGIVTAIDEARGASNWDGGGAVYIVKKFATIDQASNWFDLRLKKDLFTSQLEIQGPYNDILRYRSPIADNYNVACGYVIDNASCIMSAQYEEFYVFFNGYLSDDGMMQKDFLEIVQFIDGKMKDLLY